MPDARKKLTDKQAEQIRKSNDSLREAGKKYKISYQAVAQIRRGITYKTAYGQNY